MDVWIAGREYDGHSSDSSPIISSVWSVPAWFNLLLFLPQARLPPPWVRREPCSVCCSLSGCSFRISQSICTSSFRLRRSGSCSFSVPWSCSTVSVTCNRAWPISPTWAVWYLDSDSSSTGGVGSLCGLSGPCGFDYGREHFHPDPTVVPVEATDTEVAAGCEYRHLPGLGGDSRARAGHQDDCRRFPGSQSSVAGNPVHALATPLVCLPPPRFWFGRTNAYHVQHAVAGLARPGLWRPLWIKSDGLALRFWGRWRRIDDRRLARGLSRCSGVRRICARCVGCGDCSNRR